MSRIELEGVISFYHFFHTEHAGLYTIYLNNALKGKAKANALKHEKRWDAALGDRSRGFCRRHSLRLQV